MQSLNEIYYKYFDGQWPDMYSVHSYGEVYEQLFEPYRETAANILEIGLFTGARLKIWEEFFAGRVYGIDCDEQPGGGMADLRPMIASGKHNITIMDACSESDVKKHFSDLKFDVIIEDAQHHLSQQVELYNIWKHYLTPNSLYIIEDVQDIDATRDIFLNLDPEKKIEIIDRREQKGRYDDVLIVITPNT